MNDLQRDHFSRHANVVAKFIRDKDLNPTDWQNGVRNSCVYEDYANASYATGIAAINGPMYQLIAGDYTDNVNGAGHTSIRFSPSILAAWLSGDLNPSTVGTGLDVYAVFDDDSTHLLPVRSNTTNGGDTVNGFRRQVGIVANMPVKEIGIFEGPQTDLGSAEAYHDLDLYFSYVPEPTTIGLMSVFGTMLLMRRREVDSPNVT